MARNTVREQLLAEAKAARRAVGKKVSRLERAGVRVRKAELDPRVSNSALEAMNTRQLRSHVNRLNQFRSRSTSYVAGHKGEPLNGTTWRQYQRLERIYNKKATAFYENVRELRDPVTNTTFEERLADLRDKNKAPRAGDYRSFNPFERSAGGITGNESLKKLLKNMAKRADPQYLEREARLQRRMLNKMLARTGNKDLIEKFKDMSDEDVITVTQYTDFMSTLESSYAMVKSISTDTPRWQSSVYEDNEEKIREWVDWASRHFAPKPEKDSEQDSDDTGITTTKPGRDRYGRFVRADKPNADPAFQRDSRGRFAKRNK